MALHLVYLLVVTWSFSLLSYGNPQVPCYFIFGASYYDNGNNNALLTTAKANFLPYGIDFPQGATGRFSNGRNTPDFIAELLGFNSYIQPFLAGKDDQDILTGVNYASGSSGIRFETGMHLGARYSMDEQLWHHLLTVSRIAEILTDRNSSAEDYLNKCLYSVAMGDNDYINNYFNPQFYPTSKLYTPDQYGSILIEEYDLQLRTLYKLGARKVAVIGIGPLGCAPVVVEIAVATGASCADMVNNGLQIFNTKLVQLVNELNRDLPDAKFIYVNAFQIYSSLFTGFKVTNASCCEVITGTAACVPLTKPCPDRDDHFWWDGLHPSESINRMFALRSYKTQSPLDTFPFDISHLIQI
ncbi:hypothetical protein K2173_021812 [Erythroxylum novogranatense]|uniref:GDSL esterase/lipase n=1 Tax=Erythroxylum novogranatense TaxID=1862640 RepID=A0AAV8TVH6_9ROSI|nr:hypothetical protein K2173_021812 [Erythroxylum novogranatense]